MSIHLREKKLRSVFKAFPVALVLGALSPGLQAQSPVPPPEPAQLLNLSASAVQQASQDWLRVVVRTTLDGADAMGVQRQLKKALDEALQQLGPQVQPRQLEVSTGAFGVQPRYSDKGRVIGWQGQADLVIEGRDFARIAQAVAQVPRMPVESAQFSLSREGRQKLEAEVQSQAVQNFRQRAQALARDFGFAGYTLRQVNVSSAERPEPVVQARMMVTADAAPAPSPIPLVAGKDEVRITVSGSIQLR
jgi:predicted secreted protein